MPKPMFPAPITPNTPTHSTTSTSTTLSMYKLIFHPGCLHTYQQYHPES